MNPIISHIISDKRKSFYILSLLLFTIGLPTSNAITSIATVSLATSWIFVNSWKDKIRLFKENRIYLWLIAIFIPYGIGFFFTSHVDIALKELTRSLYWIMFPIIFMTSPKLSKVQIKSILMTFVFTVLIACCIVVLRLVFAERLGLSVFRQLTLVDHIPFAYQISFAIWILIYSITKEKTIRKTITKITLIILGIIFMLYVLLIVKSLTAYIYFIAMSLIGGILLLLRINNKRYKAIIITLALAMIIIPGISVSKVIFDFYNIEKTDSATIDTITIEGNPYKHDFNIKLKENGHYVFLYLCEPELSKAWNERSNIKYDSCLSEHSKVRDVIIRYMTSKGLRKDAEGVKQLTPEDIKNIEAGVTNYKFKSSYTTIYERVYETIWEMDVYMNTRNPNDKSFATRLELLLLAHDIVKENSWFGIGLGDNKEVYTNAINAGKSKLDIEYITLGNASTVNQYLSYLLKFGVIGLSFILFCLLIVFFQKQNRSNFLLVLFFTAIMIANFGESNFENFLNFIYFIFFFCLLIQNNLTEKTESVKTNKDS